MKRGLDLADIQGNIVRPYGRYGFPVARHLFFNIGNAAAGRRFLDKVRRVVTTAERWRGSDAESDPNPNAPPRPLVAVNIGLSYRGLVALALPTRTLSRLPEEFIDGMAKRWSILGDLHIEDVNQSGREQWDPIWRDASIAAHKEVHVWITLTAQMNPDGTPVAELAEKTAWLQAIAAESGGVKLLSGHRGDHPEYQDSATIMDELSDGTKRPTDREHFGFSDGIADPTFEDQYEPAAMPHAVIGGGKIVPGKKGWQPLASGEFILGHASEAQELPPTAAPWSLMRNGTFAAFRKLHQNTARFHAYVDQQAALLSAMGGVGTQDATRATILAKMVGRWRSGIPLSIAPTYEEAKRLESEWADIRAIQGKRGKRSAEEEARLAAYERLVRDIRFEGDAEGAKCPAAAHIRRTNPRDSLEPSFATPDADPSTSLTNRRRILRRGLPYGDASAIDDASEHGLIFVALCASLFRQFEFIQQQWVNYGSSFGLGNDTDPIVGIRRKGAKFVIPTDPNKDGVPFICAAIPQFVETRGGEYFLLPSLTALRQIAEGSVDPT